MNDNNFWGLPGSDCGQGPRDWPDDEPELWVPPVKRAFWTGVLIGFAATLGMIAGLAEALWWLR